MNKMKSPLLVVAGAVLALLVRDGLDPAELMQAAGGGGPVTVTVTFPMPDQAAGETLQLDAPGYDAMLLPSSEVAGYVDLILTPTAPVVEADDLMQLLQNGSQ